MPTSRHRDGEQRGLPGVLPEEAALPSEVVLDGGVLARRLKEARAVLMGLLLDRPDGFTPAEWRVVQATLAPPAAHLRRAAGSVAARYSLLQVARDCFPELGATQAVARFREAQALPHVAEFVANVRALELLDTLEQRGQVREALAATLANASALYDPDLRAMPGEWAKVSACVTAAAKVLVDMDGLKATAPPDPAQDSADTEARAAEVAAALVAKVKKVGEDLRARRVTTAETC